MKPVPKPQIEAILEMIVEGDSYRTICEKTGMKLSTLADFLATDTNSPRVRAALAVSADAHAEKAEACLLNAPSTMPEIGRARELASYYKWLSAKRNPRIYSEKQQVDLTTTTKTIRVRTPKSSDESDSTETETN